MDPFSLSVGIASLVALAATTVSAAKGYMSRVKNAKGSAAVLVTELEALQLNLSRLDEFLRSDSATGLAFQRTSVLRSCTSACEGNLKSLLKKLGQLSDSKTSRYLWPLNENEHQKTIQELRAFTQWIQFALSVDGCSLLSRTSDDVLRILEKQLESFRELQTLEDKMNQIEAAVKDQTVILQDERDEKMRTSILNWISKLEHDQKHHAVRSPRVQGTGGWLLERPEYVRWRDDVSASSVLWCHGIQGSGKTVLTSMIIDELKSSISDIECAVAFFYFDYQDQNHQTPSSILSSILRQIVASMPEIPKCVTDAYEKTHEGSLPLHELENLMLTITRSMKRTYIIIDALDECDESKCRRTFLQFVDRLKQTQTVRLFVTSRQYPQDINAAFHAQPQIIVQAHESDLMRYMSQELGQAGVDDIVDKNLAITIVHTLITRAQGMFLLPILQLRTVLKEPTAGAMEDALASLSRSLPEAFEETIARIQRLPESRRQLGIGILMWICHAKRALEVSELSDALSIKLGQQVMSPKHRPSPKMMLECCQGLATIDTETMSIRLAHYSIQEYLAAHSDKLFLHAEANIAAICLTYLLFDTFKQGPCLGKDAIYSRIKDNPFIGYAARHWGLHAQRSETDQNVQRLIFAFLGSRSAVAYATQIMQFNKGYRKQYWTSEECYSTTALHLACNFGLENTVQKLLDEGNFPVDATTKMGSTPFIKAASRGHVSIVRALSQRGANPYLENWYGNALHCAAEGGYSSTIQELVRHGMSANACKFYDRIPIHCTLDNDHADAFETLINLGADINARDKVGLSAIHRAALEDCVEIMDLILRRRWASVENKARGGLRAMHFAAIGNNTSILLRLLEAGADINAPDNEGRTPLNLAIYNGNKEATSLLLEHGGDLEIYRPLN